MYALHDGISRPVSAILADEMKIVPDVRPFHVIQIPAAFVAFAPVRQVAREPKEP